MKKLEHLWAAVFFVAISSLAVAAQQQGTTTGSKPGSAMRAVEPATVTSSPEPASMTIVCQSAVDLMITDPQGRRLGDDPIAHANYDEIPSAYYEAGGIDDDETGAPEEDPAKTIFIPNPVSGSYKLTIVGAKAGKYSCEFTGQDGKGTREPAELKDLAIRTDEVQVFMVRFPATVEAKIEVMKKK